MNRRTFKKHCQRARDTLIARHGYRPENFDLARGDETLDAPHGMERRYAEHGFIQPLRGTPLLWRECPIYSDGDYVSPHSVLQDIELWEKFEPTAEDLAA